MRKLLLATVAALGASMAVASYASAQVVDDSDGQGFPTPGTVTVRLNGRFRFYAGITSEGASRAVTNNTATALTSGGTANQGSNKISNYGFVDYARLYPGFDGVAANGLKYGASIEIRTENAALSGGGVAGSINSADRERNDLYIRRQWGYIGTDKFGTLRLGSADGPTSLMLTGTSENFNDGNWNGDAPDFLPGANVITWPWADTSGEYTTTKAVYLSPQFYGVDIGLSYEPSTSNGNYTNADCGGFANNGGTTIVTGTGVASAGCDTLSSTSIIGETARRRNTYEAEARYRGTFGPIGVAATGSWVGSGRVQYAGVSAPSIRYDDLGIMDFGLALTYGGFGLQGNYQRGHYTGAGYGLAPEGAKQSDAFIVGATYTIGPVIVGASYMDENNVSQNASAVLQGRQLREHGVSAGGTYTLAPGVSLFLSYLWDERRQNGVNLVGNASAASGFTTINNNANNKLSAQVLSIGTSFAW
ncbi:porin [Acidisphaera sp. L21]|jgi:hypothetical protein|uniref:porin n=1 Tax=Acidisphaera sp. L21 TaxID=1641851 RepID=UPI00131B7AAD|nr:porin [Acidisphaera sp. L21]